MRRETRSRIRFVLEELLPPIVRDGATWRSTQASKSAFHASARRARPSTAASSSWTSDHGRAPCAWSACSESPWISHDSCEIGPTGMDNALSRSAPVVSIATTSITSACAPTPVVSVSTISVSSRSSSAEMSRASSRFTPRPASRCRTVSHSATSALARILGVCTSFSTPVAIEVGRTCRRRRAARCPASRNHARADGDASATAVEVSSFAIAAGSARPQIGLDRPGYVGIALIDRYPPVACPAPGGMAERRTRPRHPHCSPVSACRWTKEP